jgi:hypothetical protein
VFQSQFTEADPVSTTDAFTRACNLADDADAADMPWPRRSGQGLLLPDLSERRARALVVQLPALPGDVRRERCHVHEHLDVGFELEGSDPLWRTRKLDSLRVRITVARCIETPWVSGGRS